MNSIWVRANAVFVYGLVVLGAIAFGCAMTTYWLDKPPTNIEIKVNELHHLLPFGRSGFQGERANFTFSVSADFRPVFNWYTRQIFVYITAEYETKYRSDPDQTELCDYSTNAEINIRTLVLDTELDGSYRHSCD